MSKRVPKLTDDAAEFVRILKRQCVKGIESGDWQDCGVIEIKKRHGDIHIDLSHGEVAFVFRRGRLVGLYNYKQ